MALSTLVDKHHLILIEQFPSDGKTKPVAQLLKKLNANRRSLIAPASHDSLLVRATRNMQDVDVLRADSLNTYDVLRTRHLVLPVASLEVIAKTFFTKK